VNSFPSSPLFSLSLRGEWWKSSIRSLSIQIHSNSWAPRNKVDQIDDEARLSWGTIVKTKQLSPTSLAFMQLVPGDDRAVRHICIRCIKGRTRFNAPMAEETFLLISTTFLDQESCESMVRPRDLVWSTLLIVQSSILTSISSHWAFSLCLYPNIVSSVLATFKLDDGLCAS